MFGIYLLYITSSYKLYKKTGIKLCLCSINLNVFLSQKCRLDITEEPPVSYKDGLYQLQKGDIFDTKYTNDKIDMYRINKHGPYSGVLWTTFTKSGSKPS